MITLERYPISLVSGSPIAVYNRFASCHNPVIFQFQRKDFQFTYVANSGGYCAFIVAGMNLNVNDYVYVKGNKVPGGTYQITNASSGVIVIDLAYTPAYATDSGYINSDDYNVNWSATVNIYNYVSNVRTLFDTVDLFADVSGLVEFDISKWLQAILASESDYAFANLNESDPFLSVKYTIGYLENVVTSPPSTETIITPLYCINASQQAGNSTDEFDNDKLVYARYAVNPVYEIKNFLNGFEFPEMVAGEDFELGFIFSDEIDYDVYLVIEEYNSANTLVATSSTQLSNSYKNAINRINLTDTYNSATKYIKAWLAIDDGSYPVGAYVADDYVADDYV